ncbi:Electron transfer flavoprotein alpha-subunit [Saitoella coloradoensis]
MFALRSAAGLRVSVSVSISIKSSRLLSTLAILEHRQGKWNSNSLSALTAATQLGPAVTAFIAGSDAAKMAAEAAKFKGVEKVLTVENDAYDKGLPENFAPLVVENVKEGGFTHVVTAHTAFGKNTMPRVAALLDVAQVSDIVGIESEDTFRRPIYAGNAIATIKSLDSVKVITVRPSAFDPAGPPAESNAAPIESGKDPKITSQTAWISEQISTSARPDLGSAARVVSGGRGLKDKENFDKVITPLADALGAAIGASRAAVDAGYADNALQVGQTGKIVAPELYVAVGISGAIQHLAGMKDSKTIVAINKDADAPIFQVADIGLVGDLFTTVPELTEKIKQ